MPAGTSIAFSPCFLYTPSPRQVGHFSLGTLPCPLQYLQGWTMVTVPKKELLVSCTLPAPLQCLQTSISVPITAPEPWQESHTPVLAKSTMRLTPNTESRKLTSRSIEMSRPRRMRMAPSCPPKKSLKMSPMSNPPWLKASWNWEKSNPAPPNPPPAEGPAPPPKTGAQPSDSPRVLSSLKIEYASDTSLNLSASPSFLSGWNLCASLWNALFMSSLVEVFVTPNNS